MTKQEMQDRIDYVVKVLKKNAKSMEKEGLTGYALSLKSLIKALTEE